MVDLELIQVLTIVTVSIFMTGAQLPLCTPGEEQQPHNITLNCTGGKVIWSKNDSVIVACAANKCQDYSGTNGYNVSVSSSASALIFYNVTRQSSGTFTCTIDKQDASCHLSVFARPTSVSCQPAVFQGDTVTVVCTGTRIFPNPFCKFKWIINGTESHSLQEQLITVNQTEYGDPVYYNASCSLKLPAGNFSFGSHQFQVRVYPNVTGSDTDTAYGVDSSWTSPQSVVYPSVKLECPDTNSYVEEDKPFSCTCKETANIFILANTTLSYGSTRNNSVNNVTASFIAVRTQEEIICETQLPEGTTVRVNQTIQVAFGPSIFNFEANNNSEQIILEQNSSVSFSCQAEGNPSPLLSLRKNGAELQMFNDPSHKFNLTLSYSKAMTECYDTGVYTCLAEAGKTTTNETLAVYVKCKFCFFDSSNVTNMYSGFYYEMEKL